MANLRVPLNWQAPYNATSLITHQGKATTTLATCGHLVSTVTGAVRAATSWSSDLTGVPGYSGVTFRSASGVVTSKIESSEGVRPSNMEIMFLTLAISLTEAEILAGVWVNATLTIFDLNYEAVDMGQLVLMKGPLGSIVQQIPLITVEAQSWSSALSRMIGTVTRPECANDFGDTACGVALATHTKTGTLTSVTSTSVFIDTARTETADYFQNGKITFTSGPNSGLGTFQIDAWDATTKTFTLRRPLPYTPAVGNAYTAVRGCRKRFSEDCIVKFSNGPNFKGFPHIPTPEQLLRMPTS